MKCSSCGLEYQNGNFCPSCGAQASPQPTQPIPLPRQQPQYAPPPYAQTQYIQPQYAQPQYAPPPAYTQQTIVINTPQQSTTSDKSRNIYALLGFFLGGLGIHDFYAGRVASGVIYLLILFGVSIFGWFLVPLLITPFIPLSIALELMLVHKDGNGKTFKDNNSPLALILGILIILFFIGSIVLCVLFLVPLIIGMLGGMNY